jgi:endoglucanase
MFKKIVLAAIILGFTCCVVLSAEPDAFEINKLIGRGVNLGNALEAPKEGDWEVTLQEEYFQLIKDAGFNSIRLPIRWSTHTDDKPPYTIDPNFLSRIDWAVKNALSRNLVLIFNTHNFYELYSDPNNKKEWFLAIWKQIAEHYKDYPATLLFEPLNEPQDKLGIPQWNELIKEVLAVIRQSNPNRIIVIGPANFNEVYKLKNLDLPKDDRNIVVTFHYYEPYRFTHQGAPWITHQDSTSWVGMKWTGTDQEKLRIAKDFDVAAKWGKENNRPIYLGEFGAYKKADMDSRVLWTKFVAEKAAERGFSMSYWDFCANFAVYDTETKTWHKGLLDAVIPPKQ